MLSVKDIVALQQDSVIAWHSELVLTQQATPWTFIEKNSEYNFLLWHEEDIARIPDIDPLRMVTAKRNIDKYNQLRNSAIEAIDEWILSSLRSDNSSSLPMHSETPGMMIDRLSIMSLKKYHMNEETLRPD